MHACYLGSSTTLCGLSITRRRIAPQLDRATCQDCLKALRERRSLVLFTVPVPQALRQLVEQVARERGCQPDALLLRFVREQLPRYLESTEE